MTVQRLLLLGLVAIPSGFNDGLAAPLTAPGGRIVVSVAELSRVERAQLGFEVLLSNLRAKPQLLERVPLDSVSRVRLGAWPTAQAGADRSELRRTWQKLRGLCARLDNLDGPALVRAIALVEEERQQRERADFQAFLASLPAQKREEALEYLSSMVQSGQISKADSSVLTSEDQTTLLARFRDFCSRPEPDFDAPEASPQRVGQPPGSQPP
jgi:hypothetical protein